MPFFSVCSQAPVMDQVLDIPQNFLPDRVFREMEKTTPSPESPASWAQANVHHREKRQNILALHVRHNLKAPVTVDLRRHVHSWAIHALLGRLRAQMKTFRYLFARHSQAEWLLYKPGMFFHEHEDFERYICNGMIPYVLLIGMRDTIEGGETKVDGKSYIGSARRNGAVFSHPISVTRRLRSGRASNYASNWNFLCASRIHRIHPSPYRTRIETGDRSGPHPSYPVWIITSNLSLISLAWRIIRWMPSRT